VARVGQYGAAPLAPIHLLVEGDRSFASSSLLLAKPFVTLLLPATLFYPAPRRGA
jgi:hypothetical protein